MKTEERQDNTMQNRPDNGCCAPAPPAGRSRDVTGQVQILAALADPTRLQIVELLAAQTEPLCVCEIVAYFTLGQPTISHHLRVLREARLVTWEKRGLWVYYALNRASLTGLTGYLGGVLAEMAPVMVHSA